MPQEQQAVPTRVTWEQALLAGHEVIDAQHQGLLAQCNLLADACRGDDPRLIELQFDQALAQLKTLARDHFETEAVLLAGGSADGADDQGAEYEEFGYLADEIATTEHFDRPELQRFLALWCLGHVTESAALLRACLEAAGPGSQVQPPAPSS